MSGEQSPFPVLGARHGVCGEAGLTAGVTLVQVPPELVFEAAVRLVGDQTDDPHSAAERFLGNAGAVGIDLSLLWATVSANRAVRQVSLAVLGAGGTAMMFVSGPARKARRFRSSPDPLGGPGIAAQERVAVLQAACVCVGAGHAGKPPALMAQALLESKEKEALAAFVESGFSRVGDLAYLRRVGGAPEPAAALPEGVRLRSVDDLRRSGMGPPELDRLLAEVLDRTYIDTLDCPELCGLRSAGDVLASHRAVGRFDPSLWWVVFAGETPIGCALFNLLPEQEAVELVYLGLDPAARGRGIGRAVLERGLRHLLGKPDDGAAPGDRGRVLVGPGGVTCAVDSRNTAALRLYGTAGFRRFAVRVPVVRGLRGLPGQRTGMTGG